MSRISAWLRKLMLLHGSPHGIAGGFALGVGLSLVPVPFAGMLVALALAPVLRLNPPATYLGTAVINPLTGSAFYFGELWLGLSLTGQTTPTWLELRQLGSRAWWDLFGELLGPFALGAALFMVVGSALSYALLWFATRRWQARRHGHDDTPSDASGPKKRASADAPAPLARDVSED